MTDKYAKQRAELLSELDGLRVEVDAGRRIATLAVPLAHQALIEPAELRRHVGQEAALLDVGVAIDGLQDPHRARVTEARLPGGRQ